MMGPGLRNGGNDHELNIHYRFLENGGRSEMREMLVARTMKYNKKEFVRDVGVGVSRTAVYIMIVLYAWNR